jgi:pimeloyl-ACP methyl ester carboxylesterase
VFAGKKLINGIELYLEYDHLKPASERKNFSDPKEIPYIIMHGHSANHFFMKPLYDAFRAQGLPVLMFDLRGHGWSQKNLSGQYTLDRCVEDLHALYETVLKQEFGYTHFYLSGHSMGGFIAMKYALQNPDTLAKLVLLSTSPRIVDGLLRRIGLNFVIRGFKTNYAKWFGMKKKDHIRIGLEFFPQWDDSSLLPDPTAIVEFMEDMKYYSVENRLGHIAIPTFVCMSRFDGTMTLKMYQKLVQGIPGAKGYLFDKYKHNITIEARAELPQLLMDFFY